MTKTDDDQDDGMESGLRLAERDLLERMLHNLPDAPPPRAVWERIAEQAEAEGLFRRHRTRQWLAATAGLAAAVLVAAIWLPTLSVNDDDGPFPTEPPYVARENTTTLEALRVRSQWLERNLQRLPAERGVMRAGTAATIGELEDRIAAIDHALSDPEGSLTPAQTERYWRERVRLMDSLLAVRYAQASRNSM